MTNKILKYYSEEKLQQNNAIVYLYIFEKLAATNFAGKV